MSEIDELRTELSAIKEELGEVKLELLMALATRNSMEKKMLEVQEERNELVELSKQLHLIARKKDKEILELKKRLKS